MKMQSAQVKHKADEQIIFFGLPFEQVNIYTWLKLLIFTANDWWNQHP